MLIFSCSETADIDSLRKKNSHERLLSEFGNYVIRILCMDHSACIFVTEKGALTEHADEDNGSEFYRDGYVYSVCTENGKPVLKDRRSSGFPYELIHADAGKYEKIVSETEENGLTELYAETDSEGLDKTSRFNSKAVSSRKKYTIDADTGRIIGISTEEYDISGAVLVTAVYQIEYGIQVPETIEYLSSVL